MLPRFPLPLRDFILVETVTFDGKILSFSTWENSVNKYANNLNAFGNIIPTISLPIRYNEINRRDSNLC